MRPLLCVFSLLALPSASAADWPQFRGPAGDGCAQATGLPQRWGGFDAPAWQTQIPGRGWSSPVVTGDRIWLTAAEETALPTKDREQRLAQGFYRDFAEQFQAHSEVACLAVEVSARNGEVLRTIELFTSNHPQPIHATNTYASPTPASDGERLICHFGSLGTACLELATGNVLWRERFAVDDITGPGSSPAIAERLAIIPCDGADQQYVVAIDVPTGQTKWKAPRPPIANADGKQRRSFSTPLIIEHAGRKQAIVPGAQWVVAYEPTTGRELWRVNFGDGHAIVPRPVYRDGLVYICTGYVKPQLWAIRVDGQGDVTETHVVWKHDRQVPEISSPIVVGSELYFVSSLGVLSCLDAQTGEPLWQHRIGGNYAASPLAADGKLYFTSREGLTTVLRPGREYQELSQNQLFGQTYASLAISGQSLLIRADRTLYCVGQPEVRSPKTEN